MTLRFEESPQHNHERRLGRRDRYFIRDFTEVSDPELANHALQVHGEGYVNEGFVNESALMEDGSLPSDIDKARGETVKYYLSTGWDVNMRNTLTTEYATMRKVSIPEGSGIEALPAYQLCAEQLEPVYKDYLESIENPSETLKEISALARTENASPMAVFELLRDSLQDAREHNEVWFFSIVSTTYQSLVDNFGPNAVKQIGSALSFEDSRINPDIQLVPALVHTDLFIDEIRRTIMESNDVRQQKQLTRSFMFFTEGLPADTLSQESVEFRDYIHAQMAAKLSKRAG